LVRGYGADLGVGLAEHYFGGLVVKDERALLVKEEHRWGEVRREFAGEDERKAARSRAQSVGFSHARVAPIMMNAMTHDSSPRTRQACMVPFCTTQSPGASFTLTPSSSSSATAPLNTMP